jgi:hypothetical protein
MAYSRRSSSRRRSRAIISAIIALGWSSSPAIPATGSIDNVSQDMKTKVGNYIKTATYYTITNATTPTVVSDPKTGAIYTHCIFFRSENGGGNLYLQRPDDDGGKTFFPILCA